MPKLLKQAVEKGLAAMQAATGHELVPEFRQAIYGAVGPVGELLPDRVRGFLAIITAQHVLPLFEQYQPYHDTTPADLIALGENVLSSTVALTEAVSTLHGLKAGQWPSPDMHPAGYWAGRTALRAVDEVLGYNGLDYDYDGVDVAMTAARAVCDGWAFPHKKEPNKLRAFWEWWLLEAIPTAWEAAQS